MRPTKAASRTIRTVATSLDSASPELRRLVERLVRDARLPPGASPARIRKLLAAGGMIMSEGEILHAQDCTSFVIELDQIIEQRARRRKDARRARGTTGSGAAAEAIPVERQIDDSASIASAAPFGALDQPERSPATGDSVEDPLGDWPEAGSEAATPDDDSRPRGSGRER